MVPPHRRKRNIRKSVEAQLGDTINVATVDPDGGAVALVVPVYHQGGNADPDSVRDPAATPDRNWIQTEWLTERAGSLGKSVWQLDVYSVDGSPDGANSDVFGDIASDIADEVEDHFSGPRGGGDTRLKAWINIQDYTVPAAPVPTDVCVMISPNGSMIGNWGSPASRTNVRREGDFHRVTITYEMALVTDGVDVGLRFGA